jgi:TolB-like protein/tetratricopeptide (TPR) repeat protein
MDGVDRRLDSWKEIAAYFNRDVTTVRRWERSERLPVHRHLHGSRSSVYASTAELDAWWARRSALTRPALSDADGPKSPSPRFRARAVIRTAPLILLAIGALSLPVRRTISDSVTTVAVLPFTASSSSAEVEYLSEGLTEALTDRVATVNGLRVTARSSVLSYRRRPASLEAIAADLDVDAVFAGSIAMSGERVEFSVDLVDAASGRRLWQGRYAGNVADLLGLQETLLDDVTRVFGRGVTQRPAAPRVTLDAYWMYLKARHDWNRRTPESLRDAARLFNRAAELDSRFALAFAGAADAESLIGYYRAAPLDESLTRAEAAARHALSLDDSLAEAHAALGQVHATRWRWSDAEAEYRRALELNPSYATARHWRSNLLSVIGADDEAIAEARAAVALDPRSPIVRSGALANALRRAGRYDEALAEYARTLELDPAFWNARMGQAMTFAASGMQSEAIREAALVTGMRPSWTASAAAIYGGFGASSEARRLLRTVEGNAGVSQVTLAQVYTSLGEIDRAAVCLQRAFDEREPDLPPVVREPWFRQVRRDPRVAALVVRLGLPEPRR